MQKLEVQKALNPAYRKIKPNRRAVDRFLGALKQCLHQVRESEDKNESEEHSKAHIRTFLKQSFYEEHYINTKDRIDLAIYVGSSANSEVGVLLETKKIGNRAEFPSADDLNKKALRELLLYYLRERIDHQNNNIKQLVATNGLEWFLFKGEDFYQYFFKNKKLIKEYEDFRDGKKDSSNNELFYREIASKYIAEVQEELPFVHLDFNEIDLDDLSDRRLNNLYKLFSPVQWLGESFGNDSNQLNKAFYHELLHIIGLKEVKQGAKKVIERLPEKERSDGSLIENAIEQLEAKDKLSRFPAKQLTGDTRQEKLFHLGLDLCITWVNRILFLKLLEAQLLQYNQHKTEFAFLNIDKISDFDDMDTLFFSVLAKRPEDRTERVREAFAAIPYLNSSLFETTELEHNGLFISELDDYRKISVYSKTQLLDSKNRKENGELDALSYLFRFLDAYDFAGDTEESIQEDNKNLINASVLGLIFEKINGYKEGSFFTPGFITMYMCRETVRKAVLQKFSDAYGEDFKAFDQLKSYCYKFYQKEDVQAFNTVINSLKICDPAVGSGHFLVSALNEFLAVKSELGLLVDEEGLPLRVSIHVANDELVITDKRGHLFEYKPEEQEAYRIQKSIFHEKQRIIENCLFGVDINPNSVKICRLRLWIELLKHAYYRPMKETDTFPQLETLPNIDINIKSGNSLISRFELDADLSKALKKSKWNIESYQNAVITYRHARNKEQKREMLRIIQDIKSNFRSEINKNDPRKVKLEKARGELFNMTQQTGLFEQTKAQQKAWQTKLQKLNKDIKKLEGELEAIKNNKIYENAFEWRFEFPEVLDDKGNFRGFDIVIGNPPYMLLQNLEEDIESHLKNIYTTASYKGDTFSLFIELANILSNHMSNLIIPQIWLSIKQHYNLRKLVLNQGVDYIIYLPQKVFENADLDTTIIQLNKKSDSPSFKIGTAQKDIIKINSNGDKEIFKKQDSLIINLTIDKISAKILDKINSKSIHLEKIFEVSQGYIPYRRKDLVKKYGVKKGNQIVDNREWHSNRKIDDNYKQEIQGKDITRYNYKLSNSFIYYGRHVAGYVNPEFFKSPRVIVMEVTRGDKYKISSTYINEEAYNSPSIINIIHPKNHLGSLKLLNGLLNSKLFSWYHLAKHSKSRSKTSIPKILVNEIRRLPIIDYEKDKFKNPITQLVNQILTAKEADPEADTTALEEEIDVLVYHLYGLSYEEVLIIDPDLKLGREEFDKGKI